jgi:hypothetical protein
MAKKPLSNMDIERNLRALAARHGINPKTGKYSDAPTGGASGVNSNSGNNSERALPTITVYPSAATLERLAHFGADCLIASNAEYDAQCARLDAQLAGILERVGTDPTHLPRSKSTRAERVLMND